MTNGVNWLMVASSLLNLGASVWAATISRDLGIAAIYAMWGAGNMIMAFRG